MPIAHEVKAFASSSNILLVTKVITISSIGIFAGTALNYNTIVMPSLRKFASSSSLAVWAEMYLLAKPIQISTITISALGGMFLFYKTANPYYLYSAVLMASIAPYTFSLLYPINNKLLEIRKHGGDDRPVEEMLVRWDTIHFGRTVISYGAFFLTLYGALRGAPAGRAVLLK
ncbi:hypothetical protein BGZ95_011156 [Linnemannia exigua]|uniref:DUF1772-domain-containing protein n=1 Tax=Linnemannia exigua TaxID=604196 RepID=A0AAD4DAB6_9FUNG|nr:hypothetical protein BGZ95_011156 [Linnemannia exigua]